jgi:2-hydroxychromene-2-carboxylate isomerase
MDATSGADYFPILRYTGKTLKLRKESMDSIAFYFDFVSPYAYLASNAIEALADRHGKKLYWSPFRLGVAVVKIMGLKPLLDTPLKGHYARHDVSRMAKVLGMPLTDDFSMFDPVPAQQLMYSQPLEQRPALAKALLNARWAEGRHLGDMDTLFDVAQKAVDIDKQRFRETIESTESRNAVNEATHAALSRGVFGSPTFAAGNELFWGGDRIWLLDQYLAAGERYVTTVVTPLTSK